MIGTRRGRYSKVGTKERRADLGNKFLEGKEVIEIVVRKDKATTNFKLVRDKDDIYLVFNQNQLGKQSNVDLWEEIQGQFAKTEPSAFPAKPK